MTAPTLAPAAAGVDARLLSLTVAAEQGEPCPPIGLLSGGWLLQGMPTSTRGFLEATHADFYSNVRNTRDMRRFGGSENERDAAIRAVTYPMMKPFEQVGPDPGASSLSLVGVSAYPPGAPSIHIPAVRVPLSLISAWWATGFVQDRATGGGASFAFAGEF